MNNIQKNNTILITGGAGYIGSHCVLTLLSQGYNVVIVDNLSTGHIEIVEKLKTFGNLFFYNCDILNSLELNNIFSTHNISAVIHFAAFSQVGESVKNPQKYYQNNVCGTLSLLDVMIKNNIKKLVFSSTAAIYGEPEYIPIDESHPKNPINPYGKTKLMIENILDDYDKAFDLKSVRLRYFNVVGASSTGCIGEWHSPETHLVPNILNSTLNKNKTFEIYGNDYDTKDGTCIRDYIDIEDLINAHLLALKYLQNNGKTDFFNLGTNLGNSVNEIFELCEITTQKQINKKILPRRLGDPAVLVANNTKAQNILGWSPQRTLQHSIETAYNWEQILTKSN